MSQGKNNPQLTGSKEMRVLGIKGKKLGHSNNQVSLK